MIWFENKCKNIGCDLGRAIKSIKTLSGGNHFAEVGIKKLTKKQGRNSKCY